MDELVRQFQAGYDDYYRGYVPEDWMDEAHRHVCAYHTGWYLASLADLGQLDEVECDEDA